MYMFPYTFSPDLFGKFQLYILYFISILSIYICELKILVHTDWLFNALVMQINMNFGNRQNNTSTKIFNFT